MAAPVTGTASHNVMETSLPLPKADAVEDSGGSGAEGRARKRFQRTPGENTHTVLRKQGPPTSTSTSKPPLEPRSNLANRRRSIREHRAPLGPRPFENDHSKRVTSDASISSNNTTRSFLNNSTSEPFFSQSARANNPRFSFGKVADTSRDQTDSNSSYDFLPSVSFDDFHASIASYEPELSEFPVPGGGASIFSHAAAKKATEALENSVKGEGAQTRPARSHSLLQRASDAQKPNTQQPPANPTSMPPPSAPLSMRSRRQSQFPAPASTNSAARPPRKSLGPGMITTQHEGNEGRPTTMSFASDGTQRSLNRTASMGKSNRRETLGQSLSSGTEIPRLSSASRAAKAKSFHPTTKQTQGSSFATPDHGLASSIHAIRPTAKSPAQQNHTPSSSGSKRQSVMHAHVGGLGARTISPTDARRLKRLSMMPTAPPVPQTPPTPQPDLPPDNRSRSPSLTVPKSITPTSARATPEQNRKSLGSGPSLSSSSSISSLRALNNPAQLRNSHLLSTSRLPTPKPRSIHSSAGAEEEEVPPVPAIPKAYESPKEVNYNPFSALKPQSLARETPSGGLSAKETASGESSNVEGSSSEASTANVRSRKGSIKHRRGLTVGTGSDAEKPAVIQSVSKRNLQPLRLPPLNLLPLSTPIGTRIASFPAPSAEVDERQVTTPQRSFTKTPSTPMTASKASFFSKSKNSDEDFTSSGQLRSSSSHFHLRSETATFHTTSSTSAMPIPSSNSGARNATTPFASASLPKSSGEFTHMRSRPSGEYKLSETDTDIAGSKPSGPRDLPAPKKDNSSAHTSTSTEPETPSSGSSLRRKLSLSGWRRASSKASHRSHPSQSQSNAPLRSSEEQTEQQTKRFDMPPPKLPASATWSGPLNMSGSPVHKPRPSLEVSRRKSSGTALMTSNADGEHASTHQRKPSATTQPPPAYSEQAAHPPRTSSATLSTMQRMLGSKNSANVLKTRNLDHNLDRDDLIADEEMRKLAGKRKDFEAAAREVDELRKRAKPQERVSPNQALQMVNLNIFERGEIIDYKEVYFCGTKNAKKHVGDLNAQSANFGYDDDRGDYNIVLGDHLAYRYEVVDVLGKGSFGQVVRCVDHKTGQLVAVKIIRNKKRFHQQALVEVNILQKLREWDPENKHSMINFTQSFYFRGHLCISTELLGMNLYEFIKAHEFKGFSLRLIRRFTKQMLSALCLLKSHRVIHCDLKPENILLAHPLHSEIKVIDFGSSCFENEKVYTYIQSRFYRSPEVILGMSYGMPIDMWSLGCILAELLTGYPIFPGENEQEQLACIMEIFGPPEKHLIEKSSRKKLFFDSLGKPRVTVSSKGRRRRPSSKTLQQALKCDDEAFLDFIARCLRWDPDRRMKPDEAMVHEFITGLKRPRVRPQANGGSGTASPIKRFNTVAQTPQRTRPLPEPPVTSFKNGTAVPTPREHSSNSPVKSAAPRRHSTVNGLQSTVGVKRASNGAAVGATSSLPRVAQRSVSGKPDLASAAAIASLRSR